MKIRLLTRKETSIAACTAGLIGLPLAYAAMPSSHTSFAVIGLVYSMLNVGSLLAQSTLSD